MMSPYLPYIAGTVAFLTNPGGWMFIGIFAYGGFTIWHHLSTAYVYIRESWAEGRKYGIIEVFFQVYVFICTWLASIYILEAFIIDIVHLFDTEYPISHGCFIRAVIIIYHTLQGAFSYGS